MVEDNGRNKLCIFKLPVDYSEEYSIQNYFERNSFLFESICQRWNRFSHISEFFYDEYNLVLAEGVDYSTMALYVGNADIWINKKYWTNQLLSETLAHEITHSATEGLYLPPWLDEGIAVYTERKFKGNQMGLKKVYFGDLANWDPQNTDQYTNGIIYAHSGYVVRELVDEYGEEMISKLIIELDGKIGSFDDNYVKNIKIIEA